MKTKIPKIILICLMTLSMATGITMYILEQKGVEEEKTFGDINKDKVVDDEDVNLLKKAIDDNKIVNNENKYLYDINCDNKIDGNDIIFEEQIISGLKKGKYKDCTLYK